MNFKFIFRFQVHSSSGFFKHKLVLKVFLNSSCANFETDVENLRLKNLLKKFTGVTVHNTNRQCSKYKNSNLFKISASKLNKF